MLKIQLAPFRLFVGSANWQYEARLWNAVVIAAILGFVLGVAL